MSWRDYNDDGCAICGLVWVVVVYAIAGLVIWTLHTIFGAIK